MVLKIIMLLFGISFLDEMDKARKKEIMRCGLLGFFNGKCGNCSMGDVNEV